MMSTHEYYGSSEYANQMRPAHQPITNLDYYNRTSPYHYYGEQLHQDRRASRSATRALIGETDPAATNDQRKARQRIAVACQRCRKRKIKCSGDLGDGLGCNACRVAGAEGHGCAFMRVGSKELGEAAAERMPNGIHHPPQHHGVDTSPVTMYGAVNHQIHGRSSIPSLQTRSSFQSELDAPYDSSALDAYTYASSTVPRQDSVTSTYGNYGSMRFWPTTTPLSGAAPSTTAYPVPYSFGMLTAPSYPQPGQPTQPMTRIPSVCSDSLSPLNMSQLNSSLPPQTVHDRRLPIPAVPAHQHPSNTERRLTGTYADPRTHIHGVYSQDAVPWPRETTSSTFRSGSIASLVPPIGQPIPSIQSMTAGSEASIGYHMTSTALENPETSPTSGTTSEDYASSSSSSTASMPPPAANMRYSSTCSHGLPSIFAGEQPITIRRSIGPSHAGLYSYSSESSEPQFPGMHEQDASGHPDEYARGGSANNSNYNVTLQHPQPQHVSASAEAMTRQACGAEYQPVLSTAQRMSLANLNTTCAI